MIPVTKPVIFTYLDSAQYLNDVYIYTKKTVPIFSLEYFAKRAGLASPSSLSMILRKKRKISFNSIFKISKALRHNEKERLYFEFLVFFNQTKKLEEKELYFLRLVDLSLTCPLAKKDRHLFEFFKNPLCEVFNNMKSLPDFEDSPHWFAKRLSSNIKLKLSETVCQFIDNTQGKQKDFSHSPFYFHLQTLKTLKQIHLYKEHVFQPEKQILENRVFDFKLPSNQQKELQIKIEKFFNELKIWSNEIQKKEQQNLIRISLQSFPLTQILKEKD